MDDLTFEHALSNLIDSQRGVPTADIVSALELQLMAQREVLNAEADAGGDDDTDELMKVEPGSGLAARTHGD